MIDMPAPLKQTLAVYAPAGEADAVVERVARWYELHKPGEYKTEQHPAPTIRAGQRRDAIDFDIPTLLDMIPDYSPYRDESFRFDVDAAQRALDFFPAALTHTKGKKAKTPLYLEAWQAAIIANIYGWFDSDNLRRYREMLLYVPRKNGKSTLCAGIALYMLLADSEQGAEIYSTASEFQQARIIFDDAVKMIRAKKKLEAKVKINESLQMSSIRVYSTLNLYKAVSSEAAGKHGLNPSCCIHDEIHTHDDDRLLEAFSTGMGAREEPLAVKLTTADIERESPCNREHEYAAKIRDGELNIDNYLPVIYETPKAHDWSSDETWARANPNLGVSIYLDFIRSEFEKARSAPSNQNSFKRLYLNMKTESADRWLDIDVWDDCAGHILPTNDAVFEQLAGRECVAGLDLSSSFDLSAIVYFFQDVDGCIDVAGRAWFPESKIREREILGIPIQTWAESGWLEICPGELIDHELIRRRINDDGRIFHIREIAFDRWNAHKIITELINADGFDCVQFGQGFRDMSPAAKSFEMWLTERKIRHYGNPLAKWCAQNVSLKEDPAGNIKPCKPEKSSAYKIDWIVAACMAAGRTALDPGQATSVEDVISFR